MVKCPRCEVEISSMLPNDLPEKDLRFCPNCGHNYRYNCPICNNNESDQKNMISIIGIGYPNPDEIRCPDCKKLFYVCENKKCGRLVEPWLHHCPADGGMLRSPRLPSNTYDGTGFCDNYKIKLSLNQDKYKSKSKEIYSNENDCSELYSAKIVGGYLFVWHDTLIDILDIDNDFKKVLQPIPIIGAKKSNISQCMVLLADNIIIASEDKFLWFNLIEQVSIDEVVKGKPVGLIAGHCGVAMWTEYNGAYCLYTALCPEANKSPHIKKIDFDSDKYQLMEKSNCLAMSDTELYWQGKYGNIYKYDFFEESLKEIPFDKGKIDYMWVNSNKVSVAYSNSVQFCICEDLEGRRYEISDSSVTGFVNGVYVYKDKDSSSFEYAYILDNQIMKNGDLTYSAPYAEHVNSVLCKEDNGTSVLLSMFKSMQMGENIFVNIYAQRKDSGSPDTIWSNKINPIEMLCFEDKIFVLHKKGVVAIDRIQDNSESLEDNIIDDIQYPVVEENQEELPTDIDFELSDNIEKFVEPISITQMNKVVEIPNRVVEQEELIQKEEKPSLGFDFSNDEDDSALSLEDLDSNSTIICPHCNAKMPKDGTKFCSECGKPIEEKKDSKSKIEELLAKLKK